MDSQSEQSSKQFTVNDAANLVITVAHIWALPWELLLRRHFGKRYFDFTFFLAAIWPALFCAFLCPEFEMEWSLWAFWGMFGLAICHRIGSIRADWQGVVRHSYYNGYPILCALFRIEERVCKSRYEFGVAFLTSILFVAISPSMMFFGMGGAISLAIKWAFIQFFQEQRDLDLQDTYIEQQSVAERFRRR